MYVAPGEIVRAGRQEARPATGQSGRSCARGRLLPLAPRRRRRPATSWQATSRASGWNAPGTNTTSPTHPPSARESTGVRSMRTGTPSGRRLRARRPRLLRPGAAAAALPRKPPHRPQPDDGRTLVRVEPGRRSLRARQHAPGQPRSGSGGGGASATGDRGRAGRGIRAGVSGSRSSRRCAPRRRGAAGVRFHGPGPNRHPARCEPRLSCAVPGRWNRSSRGWTRLSRRTCTDLFSRSRAAFRHWP